MAIRERSFRHAAVFVRLNFDTKPNDKMLERYHGGQTIVLVFVLGIQELFDPNVIRYFSGATEGAVE